MTTGRLISQDEKLRRTTSRVLTEFVLSKSASNAEIASGLYRPVNSIASLIDFKRFIAARQEEGDQVEIQSQGED